MGITVEKARLPVKFELEENAIKDSRFQKVKIWVAHTGENLNNSYFEKEVLEEMANTLGNVPIVGYIQRANEDGEEDDFKGHENEIIIKNGGVNIRYAGHAYGFIPEENNYQFEIRGGKEWLTTEGYLWTKFRDAVKVFEGSDGTKSQSMEIEQVEGEVDDIGRMVYSQATFSALCILGDDVNPAMTGSTIEFFSNKKEQYQNELDSMIEAFSIEKGDQELPEDEIKAVKEDVEKVETPKENVEPEVAEIVESTEGEDNFEEKEEEFAKEDEKEKPEAKEEDKGEGEGEDEDEDPEEDEEEKDEKKKSFSVEGNVLTLNFQMSHEDIRAKLSMAVGNVEYGYNYVMQVFDERFIVEKVTFDKEYENRQSKIVSIKYSINGEEIELGEEEEVFGMFVTAEEKAEIEDRRNKIETLTTQLEELNGFKEASENSKKEELVAEFAEELGEEISDSIREKFAEFSVEQVEKEVAFEFMKKAKLERETEKEFSVSVTKLDSNETSKYGSLSKYFNK